MSLIVTIVYQFIHNFLFWTSFYGNLCIECIRDWSI